MPGVKDMDPVHSFRLGSALKDSLLYLISDEWNKLCNEISWIEKQGR